MIAAALIYLGFSETDFEVTLDEQGERITAWRSQEPLPTPEALAAAAIAAAHQATVPQAVTKRQLYRGLMQVGWLGSTMPQIDAAITQLVNSMPNPPREVARVEFFTSRDYLRSNPLLLGALMSPPLSKTVAEIDDFFRLCGSFAPEGEP